jgi:hypothetical protein
MQANETIFEAETSGAAGAEVDLWADSVGAAVRQLGLVVTLAIVAHVASSLLSDVASALH